MGVGSDDGKDNEGILTKYLCLSFLVTRFRPSALL